MWHVWGDRLIFHMEEFGSFKRQDWCFVGAIGVGQAPARRLLPVVVPALPVADPAAAEGLDCVISQSSKKLLSF